MRLDHVIRFYNPGQPILNTDTGQYDTGDAGAIATLHASVTEVGTDRQAVTFGDIDQKNLTIRTLTAPPKNWTYLTVDDDPKHYIVTTARSYRHTYTLIVGEQV